MREHAARELDDGRELRRLGVADAVDRGKCVARRVQHPGEAVERAQQNARDVDGVAPCAARAQQEREKLRVRQGTQALRAQALARPLSHRPFREGRHAGNEGRCSMRRSVNFARHRPYPSQG